MKITETKAAIDLFEKSAIDHTQASLQGDYKLANKSFSNLTKAAKYLKQTNEIGGLVKLLDHQEKGVEIWAATYLLTYNEDVAKHKLISIENADLPHYTFTSRLILKEWTEGKLELKF